MATIVPTALKVIADVQDALDKVNMVGDAMENLGRVMGKAKIDFSNIGEVFKSLDFGAQAIEKALPEFEKAKEIFTDLKELANMGENITWKELGGAEKKFLETQEQLQKAQDATENLFNSIIRRSNNALVELHKLPPSVENLKGALDMLDNLNETKNNPTIQSLITDFSKLDKVTQETQTAIERFFVRIADNAINELDKIPPTIDNFENCITNIVSQPIRNRLSIPSPLVTQCSPQSAPLSPY
jgi:hypothetical protein